MSLPTVSLEPSSNIFNHLQIAFSPFLVKFEIGGGDPKTPTNEDASDDAAWECVWKCQTASPVHHMAFSPDGTLFATSGKSDRLVKVWYENKHCK